MSRDEDSGGEGIPALGVPGACLSSSPCLVLTNAPTQAFSFLKGRSRLLGGRGGGTDFNWAQMRTSQESELSRCGMGCWGVRVGWGRRVSSASLGGEVVGETVGLLPVLPFYMSTCIRGLVRSVSSYLLGEVFCQT